LTGMEVEGGPHRSCEHPDKQDYPRHSHILVCELLAGRFLESSEGSCPRQNFLIDTRSHVQWFAD
jgi:hypothetical protein